MFNEYQKKALTTAKNPTLDRFLKGIGGETGEGLDKIWFTRTSKHELAKEIGDIFWYCATSVHYLNYPKFDFNDICTMPRLMYGDFDTITKKLAVVSLYLNELTKKHDRQIEEIGLFENFSNLEAYIIENDLKFTKLEIENQPEGILVWRYIPLTDQQKEDIIYIIADIVGYLRFIITHYNLSIEEILNNNLSKLGVRKEKDLIFGSGDNR